MCFRLDERVLKKNTRATRRENFQSLNRISNPTDIEKRKLKAEIHQPNELRVLAANILKG